MKIRCARLISTSLVLVACSNSHSDPVPIEELGGRLGTILCTTIETCYGPTISSIFLGGADCEPSFDSSFDNQILPAYRAAIAAGTLVYDGTAVGACEAALRATGCGLTLERYEDLCEDALQGTLPAGAACTLDEECMGEAFCDHAGGACPGTCQARGAAGATCSSDDGCASGLLCAGGTCRAGAGAGASCEGATNVRCGPGTFCVGAEGMMPGTCQTPETAFSAALGASCTPRGGPLCAEGLSCAFEGVVAMMPTFTCREPAASGAACRLAIPDACPSGEYCSDVAFERLDFDGTCAPLPGAGAACGGLLQRCASGTRCVAGMCTPRADNGAACETGTTCWSEICTGGVCAAPMLCGT